MQETVKIFSVTAYPKGKEGKPVRIQTLSRKLFQELKEQAFKEKKPVIFIEKNVSFCFDQSLTER